MLSYITKDYANALIVRDMYASVKWDALSDSQKDRYLNHSALLLDQAYTYAGRKFSIAQVMQFPRYYEEDHTLNGEIPLDVKEAQLLILMYLLNTENYEELKRAATLGMKKISDDLSFEAEQHIHQIPDEAALLLYPYTRMGATLKAQYPIDYGMREDIL